MKTQSKTANREISISRILNAPRELVWKVWTEPKHIDKWWGPIGFTTETHEMKVQVGSKWLCTMHGPNGMDFPNEMIYTEVAKPERLAYAHTVAPKFDCTVTFEDLNGATKLTMTMVFDNIEEYNLVVKEHGAIEGQVQTIARLEEHLSEMQEDREVVITRILNAPRELVWQAWTERNHIEKWWGPNGITTTTHEMDIRPDGKWVNTMRGPSGGDEFKNEVIFTELVKPECILFTQTPFNCKATVTFEAFGNKTKLTWRMVFDTAAQKELIAKEHGVVEGLKQTTERFEEHVAKMQEGKEFTISREFNAPRELVYKVFTQAEHLAKWWGPPGAGITVNRFNFSPGGMFLYSAKGPMGEMWGKFVYCEMVKPERVVFINSFSDKDGGITPNPFMPNWPLEILNIVSLTENEGKTTMAMRGGPINATEEQLNVFNNMHGMMQQGFAGTFKQLEDYLTTFNK